MMVDKIKESTIINDKLSNKAITKREYLYFIHIPKAAGTFIKRSIQGSNFLFGGHGFCVDFARKKGIVEWNFDYFPNHCVKPKFGKSFKFAVGSQPKKTTLDNLL